MTQQRSTVWQYNYVIEQSEKLFTVELEIIDFKEQNIPIPERLLRRRRMLQWTVRNYQERYYSAPESPEETELHDRAQAAMKAVGL